MQFFANAIEKKKRLLESQNNLQQAPKKYKSVQEHPRQQLKEWQQSEKDIALSHGYSVCIDFVVNFLQLNIAVITAPMREAEAFAAWVQNQSDQAQTFFRQISDEIKKCFETPAFQMQYIDSLWHPFFEEKSLFGDKDNAIREILDANKKLLAVIACNAIAMQHFFDLWYVAHPKQAENRTQALSKGDLLGHCIIAKVFFNRVKRFEFIKSQEKREQTLILSAKAKVFLYAALKNNTLAKELNLQGQSLEENDINALMDVLEINKTLKKVTLRSPLDKTQICDLIVVHTTEHVSRTLDLSDCYTGTTKNLSIIAYTLAEQLHEGAQLSVQLFEDKRKQEKFMKVVAKYQQEHFEELRRSGQKEISGEQTAEILLNFCTQTSSYKLI